MLPATVRSLVNEAGKGELARVLSQRRSIPNSKPRIS